jgi:N-acetyl-alpha-D-glucosaminyl L-malate synthase BshA
MTQPLSIAMVCYPSFGGSGVVARELAVGLAARGHTVTLVASDPPSRVLPQHERLRFRKVLVPHYPVFQHAPYTVAVASALVELAREQPINLIHVHYAVPHAASALLATQTLGAKAPAVVTTLHGTDVTGSGADPSYAAITQHAVRASATITVPSGYLAQKAQAWLSRDSLSEDASPAPSIEVVPNFVDTDRFAPAATRERSALAALFQDGDPAAPVLFHVSNFRAVKRVGDLFDVLQRVRKRLPARLVVVGDGPERASAELKARELGLSESVCFLGSQVKFIELLKQADAFILTSEIESFGLAALEAMSCGVPVLGYRVGGLPEVVTEQAGVLVPPFDLDALARAAVELLSDGARRDALARQARERALASFKRDPALDRYETVFQRALRRSERGTAR